MRYYRYELTRNLNECGVVRKRICTYIPPWMKFEWGVFKNHELYLQDDNDSMAAKLITEYFEKKISGLETRLANYKKALSELRIEMER